MQKVWAWIKPKLAWIAAGAGAVLSVVVAVVMMPGRRRLRPGKTPPRPTLKEPGDVEVPDVNTNINTDFNTKPADEYESTKAKANTKAAEDIDDLNKMFADKPARRPPADGVRAGRGKR